MRICAYHIIKQLSLIRNDIFSENITKNGPIAIFKKNISFGCFESD
jgi:hypothetical protein